MRAAFIEEVFIKSYMSQDEHKPSSILRIFWGRWTDKLLELNIVPYFLLYAHATNLNS